MNYVRRPNRPDGSLYRQMRRQRLSRGERGGLGFPLGRPVVFFVGAAALAAVVGWWLWR